ncbi:hypothetical protein diail_5690 [Diaporthe ilicicola]|nr:hypothetical protein diail_5690 [Diaporthe ilicicola]
MTDDRERRNKASTGDIGQDGKDQGQRRAHCATVEVMEVDVINPPETRQSRHPKGLKGTVDDPDDDSVEVIGVTPEKSSIFSKIMGMTPLARDSKNDQQKMDTEKIIRRHEKSQQDIAKLKGVNENLREENEAAQRQIQELSFRVNATNNEWQKAMDDVQKRHAHCQLALDSTRTANVKLDGANKVAHEEIARLHRQISTLNDKNTKLRQMLVPIHEKQVIDSDVARQFASLRSSILALVRQTWTTKLREDIDPETLSEDQQQLLYSKFPLTYDRLRSVVFIGLNMIIFGSQNYFLGDNFHVLEDYLRNAERKLVAMIPKENLGPVIAWRHASFEVTEAFRDNDHSLSLNTRDRIWNFLRPLQTLNPAAEENGRQRLEAICNSAVDLSLMIRQLKDNVWVEGLSRSVGRPFSDWKKFAEDIASVDVGKDQEPGTIAYVITGALLKSPKEDLEKKLVLEKAEVAVYE